MSEKTDIEKVEELIKELKEGSSVAEVTVRIMLYQYLDLMEIMDSNPDVTVHGGLVKDASDEVKEILGYE